MKRVLAATIALVAMSSLLPAHAASFRDTMGRFTVAVPDGWSSEAPANAADFTVVLSKEDTETLPGAACIGLYLDMPSTRSTSQAELNSVVEGQLTDAFWKSALQAGGDDGLKVISTGKRDRDARRIHNVVFTGTSVEDGKSQTGKGKMEVHFIPGSMHSLMCVTEEASFSRHGPAFETIFASYDPQIAPLVALAPGGTASVLTLFARASQSGQAQVVSADNPDLGRAGFNVGAASLTVDGAGSWQVCTATGYAGRCEAINGPAAAPFQVLSARRSESSAAPRALASDALRRGWRTLPIAAAAR